MLSASTNDPGGPASAAYQVVLDLSVADVRALWAAAAERLRASFEVTADDIADTIGTADDPSVPECIAALAAPPQLAGCLLEDFKVSLSAIKPNAA